MNKQQLAAKIWESANKLRSKIEANEYKDYIIGFIFYKFLSDKEEQFLRKDGWESDDLRELTEEDADTVATAAVSWAILLPMTISSLPGWPKARTLTFPTSPMRSLPSIA